MAAAPWESLPPERERELGNSNSSYTNGAKVPHPAFGCLKAFKHFLTLNVLLVEGACAAYA